MTMLREIDIQLRDRVVFLHIPKTAGTTFNAVLEPFLGGMRKYPHYLKENLAQVPLKSLRRYQFFSGHFPYAIFADFVFPEGFIGLTFLREPINRTLSGYRFMRQLLRREEIPWLPQRKQEIELVKNLTLEEFLEHEDLEIVRNLINMQTVFLGSSLSKKTITPAGQPAPALLNELQSPFHDPDRMTMDSLLKALQKQRRNANRKEFAQGTHPTLTIAQDRLKEIAFFGVTEKFQDSLFLLSYIFGLRPSLDTTRLNVTTMENRSSDLSPKIIDNIRNKVTLDLELFAFAQKLFQEHVTEMTQTLLSRYGKKEHAALQWPLPTEVMMDLLEHHYLYRRDDRHRNRARAVRKKHQYFLSERLEGLFGWYPAETFQNYGTVRWSGPGRESGFDLPRPRGEILRVSFRVLMAMDQRVIEQLALTIDALPVQLQYSRDAAGAFIFSGWVPREVSGAFLRMVFSVPETIAPHDVDSDSKDSRPLGFLLNWVKLESLEEPNSFTPSDFLTAAFGWYEIEITPEHGAFCWSGPGRESGFDLPRPRGEILRVSFRVLMAMDQKVIEQLALTIDALPVQLQYSRDAAGAFIFSGWVPREVSGAFLRMVFSVPETIAPHDLDSSNEDTRPLGILLNWVRLEVVDAQT